MELSIITQLRNELEKVKRENSELREEAKDWEDRANNIYGLLLQLNEEIRTGNYIKARRLRLVKGSSQKAENIAL